MLIVFMLLPQSHVGVHTTTNLFLSNIFIFKTKSTIDLCIDLCIGIGLCIGVSFGFYTLSLLWPLFQ